MTDLIPIELVREPMGSRQTILLPRSASLDSDSVQTPTFKGRVAAIFPDLMEVEKVEAVPSSAKTAEDLNDLGGILLVLPPPGGVSHEAFVRPSTDSLACTGANIFPQLELDQRHK